MPRTALPRGPSILILDLAVAAWIAAWILFGIAVSDSIRELTAVTDRVSQAGRAVQDSGRALDSLRDLPLVGDRVAGAARGLSQAGRGVLAEGRSAQAHLERTAGMLGLAVALIPVAPLLAFYLPARLARSGELRALRRMLRDGAGDPALERFLAERAAVNLSYRELARASREPWRDLEDRRHRRLAEAELRRVGLQVRALKDARRR